jgi:hypothetical protein
MVLLIGCTGEPAGVAEGETGEQEGPPDELFPCDMPKLFEQRCGGNICHSKGDSTAAGLDLTSPGVEQRVSGAAGNGCVGMLADPANPEASLLYTKVLDAPTCGTRMPLTGEPLTEDELTCMRDWISGLLPPVEGCEGCICEPGVSESCYSGPAGTADVGECRSGTHTCQTSGMAWSECEGEVGPQGEDCFTADIDEDCDGSMPACSEVWSRGFGNELNQVTRSVAIDKEGNVYAFGDFEGTVGYGGDPLTADGAKFDLVVSKHDMYGNALWSLRAGDSSNQYGAKMIVDGKGNLILLARIYGSVDFGGGPRSSKGSGDILVVKLDGSGQHIWSRVFGDKDPERSERVVVDAQGDVLMTGTFTSTIDFGGGPLTSAGMRDAFVVELDGETGEHVFSLQIGGTGDDYGSGIDVGGNGDIVIGGRFQDTIEIGSQLSSSGGKDIYLAKLDKAGVPQWSHSYGGQEDDELHDLRVRANGDIVVVGGMSAKVDFGGGELVSEGLRDIFLATFDAQGNHVWSSRHGDANDQFSPTWELNAWLTLALEPNGTIHIGGSLLGQVAFGGPALESKSMNPDAWHVWLAPDGSYLGGNRYGQTNSDLVLDIALSESGHVVLGGRTQSSKIDFGAAGTLISHGGGDGFIAKLPPG